MKDFVMKVLTQFMCDYVMKLLHVVITIDILLCFIT